LSIADAAICATSAPSPVFDLAALAQAGAGRARPLCIVDLGVPPNVPRTRLPGVDVVDLEQIAEQIAEERGARRQAIGAADAIVEQELVSWLDWSRSRVPILRRAAGAEG